MPRSIDLNIRIQLTDYSDEEQLQRMRDNLATLGPEVYIASCGLTVCGALKPMIRSCTIDLEALPKEPEVIDNFGRWDTIGDHIGTSDVVSEIRGQHRDEVQSLEEQIQGLRSQVASLSQALARFGGHTPSCQSIGKPNQYYHFCTCGYRKAISEFEKYTDQFFAKVSGTPDEELVLLVSKAKALLATLAPEPWYAYDPHNAECIGCTADGCVGHASGYYEVSGLDVSPDCETPQLQKEVAEFIEFAQNNLPRFIKVIEEQCLKTSKASETLSP